MAPRRLCAAFFLVWILFALAGMLGRHEEAQGNGSCHVLKAGHQVREQLGQHGT